LMKSILAGVILAVVIVAATSTWRVGDGEVHVVCPMTVGGSFDAKTTALTGSVQAAGGASSAFEGSLAVDLRTLDTGIGLRNEHLREKYLEVNKASGFDTATLTKIDLIGMNTDAPEGKGAFTGSLTVHGVTKMVTGSVEVRREGAGLHVKALFPVTLSDYGIPAPRYLGVGVKDTVRVEVMFAVTH